MRAFVLALVAGAVGGLLAYMIHESYPGRNSLEVVMLGNLLETALLVTSWAILGAIIGGAWEIAAVIKQTRPPQTPDADKKDE